MKRSDGRTEASQLRAFSASQSLLNRADGSSKFSFGESTVVASVVGPAEVKIRDEKMDEATVELIVRPAVGFPTTKDKVLEHALRQAVEPTILSGMMPRTLIQIVVQIEQVDGNILSTTVNAISLAMLDAGLPMSSLVASVSAAIDQENNILLDPSSQELENASSVHTFAFDNTSSYNLLLSHSTGTFSEDQYFSCLEACKHASERVHAFIRTAVEKKIQKEYQQLQSS
ncbi:ribosomal protein S5 domain 2-type protein [Umbelopsis sp. PMI_123]|nr:ribosomal protein S5 domain 2-type protein [Umbelopsis sp. PMI_123]